MKDHHTQVTELLPYYAAGKIHPAEASLVELHLAGCPACQHELQEWREIGQGVRTLMASYRRQVSLPPLEMPPMPNSRPQPLPLTAQTRRELSLPGKLLAFLGVKSGPVEKGKVTMKGYPDHDDNIYSGQTARPKGFYRAILGGLVTASLVAMLVLAVAIANRPDSPLNGAPTASANLGAAATKAVPTATAAASTTAATTPATTSPAATQPTAPAGFAGKLTGTIKYSPNCCGSDVPEVPEHSFVEISPDGKTIATSEKGTVKLWKAADSSLIKTVELSQPYSDNIIWTYLAWSPDNQTLAVAYYYKQNSGPKGITGQVQFWNASGDLKSTLAGLTDETDIINWSPDGKFFLTASHKYDGKADRHNMQLWDSNGKLVQTLMKDAPIPAIRTAWSPDSQLIAATVENGNVVGPLSLQIWQANGKLLTAYDALPKTSANGLAWSPDSKSLALGLVAASDNLWVMNVQQLLAGTDKPYITLNGHTDVVLQVAWSTDSKTLATSSMDNTVRLWDAASGKVVSSLPVMSAEFTETGMVWSPDGKSLAVTAGGNQIKLFDASGQVIKTLDEPGKVLSLQWSADGKTLLSVVEGGIIHAWQ